MIEKTHFWLFPNSNTPVLYKTSSSFQTTVTLDQHSAQTILGSSSRSNPFRLVAVITRLLSLSGLPCVEETTHCEGVMFRFFFSLPPRAAPPGVSIARTCPILHYPWWPALLPPLVTHLGFLNSLQFAFHIDWILFSFSQEARPYGNVSICLCQLFFHRHIGTEQCLSLFPVNKEDVWQASCFCFSPLSVLSKDMPLL